MGVGMLLIDCDSPTYNNYNVAVQSLSAGGPADNSKQVQSGPYPQTSRPSCHLAASPNGCSVVCGLWFVVCGLWFVVLWFVVCGLWFFLFCGLWFVVCGLWFVVLWFVVCGLWFVVGDSLCAKMCHPLLTRNDFSAILAAIDSTGGCAPQD